MFSRKRQYGVAYFFMAFLLMISLPTSGEAQTKANRLSLATGGTGGVYYPVGGAIARIISKYTPDTEATAEVTAASVDNLKLLHTKKADLAMFQGDTAYDAVKGLDKFKSTGPVPVRCICTLYAYPSHFVTLKDSGIQSVLDFKGRRIATGAPGSGTEVVSLRILESYGLGEKDLRRERLSIVESVGALKDRKIEAFTWIGGVPTSAILDLASTPGITIRILDNTKYFDKLIQKYGPVYAQMSIPKGIYPNVNYEVQAVGLTGLLGCREDMDPNLVYNILKAMFEHLPELATAHREISDFSLAKGTKGSTIPFHAGAIKYFQEKGIEVK